MLIDYMEWLELFNFGKGTMLNPLKVFVVEPDAKHKMGEKYFAMAIRRGY